LQLPFPDALKFSSKLAEYINQQDDPQEVAEEFQEAWGTDAPELLLSVLRKVLEGEDDIFFFRVMTSVRSSGVESHVNKPRSLYVPSHKDKDAADTENRVNNLIRTMNAPEYGTIEWGGWMPEETFAPPSSTVDDLLRMSFGEALAASEELRDYLSTVKDADVEEQFRQVWGLNAPDSVRDVLEQVLSTGSLRLMDDIAKTSEHDNKHSILQPWYGHDFKKHDSSRSFVQKKSSEVSKSKL